eukprot:scpid18532/ scgid15376/ 
MLLPKESIYASHRRWTSPPHNDCPLRTWSTRASVFYEHKYQPQCVQRPLLPILMILFVRLKTCVRTCVRVFVHACACVYVCHVFASTVTSLVGAELTCSPLFAVGIVHFTTCRIHCIMRVALIGGHTACQVNKGARSVHFIYCSSNK